MSKSELRGADRRRYHVIYKTTCLVTGRYYIGMHSTDDLADGYIGSGKRLWQSIKKHGVEQHICQVLEHLSSREALRLREAELVDEKLLKDKQCLNLTVGGYGDFGHIDNADPRYRHHRQAGAVAMNKALWNNAEWASKASARFKASTKAWNESEAGKVQSKEALKLATITAASPEVNARRKQTMQKRGHQQGSANSSFGTCWVKHPEQGSKKVKLDQLAEYLAVGWVRGRSMAV